jgi:hypothetical protein
VLVVAGGLCCPFHWEVLERASTNSPTLSSGSLAARSAWLMMPTSSSFSSHGQATDLVLDHLVQYLVDVGVSVDPPHMGFSKRSPALT